MEKNQNFFDPYNFNIQNYNPNVELQNAGLPQDFTPNPNNYYEGQYVYYRYLTQVMDYKIKCKEYENLNKEKK